METIVQLAKMRYHTDSQPSSVACLPRAAEPSPIHHPLGNMPAVTAVRGSTAPRPAPARLGTSRYNGNGAARQPARVVAARPEPLAQHALAHPVVGILWWRKQQRVDDEIADAGRHAAPASMIQRRHQRGMAQRAAPTAPGVAVTCPEGLLQLIYAGLLWLWLHTVSLLVSFLQATPSIAGTSADAICQRW